MRSSPPHASRPIRSSLTRRTETKVSRVLPSARAQIFAGVASAFLCYLILLRGIANKSTARTTPTTNPPLSSARRSTKISETKYNCSINWLRLPKTASTSIYNAFISPLTSDERLFQNTELGPNAYMTHVGGCEDPWAELQRDGWKRAPSADNTPLGVPPFGVAIDDPAYSRNVSNKRYFKSHVTKERIVCFEYNERDQTIDFGPEMNRESRPHIPASRKIRHASSPNMQTHVGLDVSLFGWMLPERPLVFSVFRDPVERLLSSSHFMISFGGGVPGEYLRCKSKNRRPNWQKQISNAVKQFTLENNSTEYQNLLREYLHNCRRAVHNVYVQFLDPGGKSLETALYNLERYVIPGLQTHMTETLSKWVNITLNSCRDHPKFKEIKRRMNVTLKTDFESDTRGGKEFYARKSQTTMKDAHSTDNKALIYPKLDQFDPDLQSLVRELTAMDEIIYQRAKEMFWQWS